MRRPRVTRLKESAAIPSVRATATTYVQWHVASVVFSILREGCTAESRRCCARGYTVVARGGVVGRNRWPAAFSHCEGVENVYIRGVTALCRHHLLLDLAGGSRYTGRRRASGGGEQPDGPSSQSSTSSACGNVKAEGLQKWRERAHCTHQPLSLQLPPLKDARPPSRTGVQVLLSKSIYTHEANSCAPLRR